MAAKQARYISNASVPIEGGGQEPGWRKQPKMDEHLVSALLFQFYNSFSDDTAKVKRWKGYPAEEHLCILSYVVGRGKNKSK